MSTRSLILAALFTASAGAPTALSAQLISIRTVPVSQAHQFEFFPSRTLSMGGITIAVPDSLLDPFTNPAAGARLRAARFYGSPSFYSVSGDAGAGRTLPIGALTKNGAWHGGLWVAAQQVQPGERAFAGVCPQCLILTDPQSRLDSDVNTYAFATLGRELTDNGLSVGGSVLWSRLNAIDGVDLLYAGAADIEQAGYSLDIRLGLLKEWADDRTLEAVVLHNRHSTAHDVFYFETFWDPSQEQFATRERLEQNLDRTNVWGGHVTYQQPISKDGWRMGWLATVNRMSHPKIPNYEIMNIPRDPGNSSAFNVGFGIARALPNATFGIDVVLEPIWSHTWADAAADLVNAIGETIPAGGMTIENRFDILNGALRMGVDQRVPLENGVLFGLQMGVGVRSYNYRLRQRDHVQLTSRTQRESWMEWTPTWGLSFGFPSMELRYRGSMTGGTGRPGVANAGNVRALDIAALASNILVAPSGPLTLDEVRVMTHEVSISVPLR